MSAPTAGDRARFRAGVARTPGAFALDRAEALSLADGTLRLRVHFFPGAPAELAPGSVRLTGPAGPVAILSVSPAAPGESWLTVVALPPAGRGPQGEYTLYLESVAGLEPRLSRVSFAVGPAPRPRPLTVSAPENGPPLGAGSPPPPAIDYLAKDYTTFRATMLDRMAVTLPAWTERSPADIGVMLVELLAAAADSLSYFQDAVGTEAYLATARLRTSLARHARLLDYRVNEGCSAVAWVQVRVSQEGIVLPAGTRLYTRTAQGTPCLVPGTAAYAGAMQEQPLPFETVAPLAASPALNQIPLYTGGAKSYALEQGARKAVLQDAWVGTGRALAGLAPGQVLVLQEMIGPGGAPADPTHRQAVRLTQVHPGLAGGVPVVEVEWHDGDALDFRLGVAGAAGGVPYTAGAVALGNLVLAQQGTTVGPWELPPVPQAGPYRPYVPVSGLSRRPRVPARAAAARPASAATAGAHALAQVWLTDGEGRPWTVRADLLRSTPFSRDFVVEADEEGAGRLRFGDGALGMAPPPGTRFRLVCRTGVGLAGNVGRQVLAHLVPPDDPVAAGRVVAGVLQVLNPLPALGGAAPETVQEVRVRAPQAYQVQRRGVTPADWVSLAESLPEVRRAGARRGWEAAGPQDRVWVQRWRGWPEDRAFLARVRAELEPYRPAGRDLRVLPPVYVGVVVAVRVRLDARTLRSAAERALRLALGSGGGGVFDSSVLTFGQGVWLSRVVAAAAAVPGVEWVHALRFARWEPVPGGPAVCDELSMAAHEVACMRDDPAAPWTGTLDIELLGGIG